MIAIFTVKFYVYNAPWRKQANDYLGSLTPVGVAPGMNRERRLKSVDHRSFSVSKQHDNPQVHYRGHVITVLFEIFGLLEPDTIFTIYQASMESAENQGTGVRFVSLFRLYWLREFNYDCSALSEPACAAFRGPVSHRALSRMAPIPSRLPAPHSNR